MTFIGTTSPITDPYRSSNLNVFVRSESSNRVIAFIVFFFDVRVNNELKRVWEVYMPLTKIMENKSATLTLNSTLSLIVLFLLGNTSSFGLITYVPPG